MGGMLFSFLFLSRFECLCVDGLLRISREFQPPRVWKRLEGKRSLLRESGNMTRRRAMGRLRLWFVSASYTFVFTDLMQMARAGFVFTPSQDDVDLATCLFCKVALSGWDEDDDPLYVLFFIYFQSINVSSRSCRAEHRKRVEKYGHSCPFFPAASKSSSSSSKPHSRSRSVSKHTDLVMPLKTHDGPTDDEYASQSSSVPKTPKRPASKKGAKTPGPARTRSSSRPPPLSRADEDVDESEEEPAPKPKPRARKTAHSRSKSVVAVSEADVEQADETPATVKKPRATKVKAQVADTDMDTAEAAPIPRTVPRSRKPSKAVAPPAPQKAPVDAANLFDDDVDVAMDVVPAAPPARTRKASKASAPKKPPSTASSKPRGKSRAPSPMFSNDGDEPVAPVKPAHKRVVSTAKPKQRTQSRAPSPLPSNDEEEEPELTPVRPASKKTSSKSKQSNKPRAPSPETSTVDDQDEAVELTLVKPASKRAASATTVLNQRNKARSHSPDTCEDEDHELEPTPVKATKKVTSANSKAKQHAKFRPPSPLPDDEDELEIKAPPKSVPRKASTAKTELPSAPSPTDEEEMETQLAAPASKSVSREVSATKSTPRTTSRVPSPLPPAASNIDGDMEVDAPPLPEPPKRGRSNSVRVPSSSTTAPRSRQPSAQTQPPRPLGLSVSEATVGQDGQHSRKPPSGTKAKLDSFVFPSLTSSEAKKPESTGRKYSSSRTPSVFNKSRSRSRPGNSEEDDEAAIDASLRIVEILTDEETYSGPTLAAKLKQKRAKEMEAAAQQSKMPPTSKSKSEPQSSPLVAAEDGDDMEMSLPLSQTQGETEADADMDYLADVDTQPTQSSQQILSQIQSQSEQEITPEPVTPPPRRTVLQPIVPSLPKATNLDVIAPSALSKVKSDDSSDKTDSFPFYPPLSQEPFANLTELTDHELDMTVEEWILYQLKVEHEKFKRDGERQLELFEARAEEVRLAIEKL